MSSMTQPPRPAGVRAPATVRPMVVSFSGRQHLVGEDVAGFRQPAGVEGLEAAFDQLADLGASAWPVVLDWLAFKVIFGGVARCSGRAMRHCFSLRLRVEPAVGSLAPVGGGNGGSGRNPLTKGTFPGDSSPFPDSQS